jgi:hypothetical protein
MALAWIYFISCIGILYFECELMSLHHRIRCVFLILNTWFLRIPQDYQPKIFNSGGLGIEFIGVLRSH